MPSQETILELIGSIYDAALEPTLWSSVLEKISDIVGGETSVLIGEQPGRIEGDSNVRRPS